jgi:hypothetical protein
MPLATPLTATRTLSPQRLAPRVVALAAVVGLGACAVPPPPAAPSFVAQPGRGKTAEQFRADDARCRSQANAANGGISPGQGANQSAIGSTIAGTALGAAAGALIGAATGSAGAGAAIGAGTGLLFGAAAGSNNAQASGYALQRNYDVTYGQCMVAAGEQVPIAPAVAAAPVLVAPAPVYVYPAYPAYYYPPVVFGYGYGYRWHHY